jgi:hypothetical protein
VQQADELNAVGRSELLQSKGHVLLLLDCRLEPEDVLSGELQEDGQVRDDLHQHLVHGRIPTARSVTSSCWSNRLGA